MNNKTLRQAVIVFLLSLFSHGYAMDETDRALKPNNSAPTVQLFLENIRSNGGPLICNQKEIEQKLTVTIPNMDVKRWDGAQFGPSAEIFRSDSTITPANASSPVISGQYSRFKSVTTSKCSITISIQPGALCNIQSESYRQAMGTAAFHTPPHPSAQSNRIDKFLHFFQSTETNKSTEIWLNFLKNNKCASSITINAHGDWYSSQ